LKEDDAKFDWDAANVEHIARHRVTPPEVETALLNGPIDIDHEFVEDEPRWTSVGHTEELRVLLIVWTMRGDALRPVTAYNVSEARRIEYLRMRGLIV
jgi:uncharacterized DUF497 family protein